MDVVDYNLLRLPNVQGTVSLIYLRIALIMGQICGKHELFDTSFTDILTHCFDNGPNLLQARVV